MARGKSQLPLRVSCGDMDRVSRGTEGKATEGTPYKVAGKFQSVKVRKDRQSPGSCPSLRGLEVQDLVQHVRPKVRRT
jgi:hypothetical protein